ncbi:putative GRIP domain-containing protein [Plasmopara halstedii]
MQTRIQSLKSELEELQHQREAETEAAEKTICSLKASESQSSEELESIRQEFAELEARLVSTEKEREIVSMTLSETESHCNAQGIEMSSMQTRIQSLESELEELQHQREAETEAAEKTICSLKASESQSSEELESIRQEFAELEARLVSTEKERETVSMTLSEMESQCNAQSTKMLSMQTRIHFLEMDLTSDNAISVNNIQPNEFGLLNRESKLCSQARLPSNPAQQVVKPERQICLADLQSVNHVRSIDSDLAKNTKALEDQVASLSESSRSALAEVASLRDQLDNADKTYAINLLKKDDVISTLKSKLGEMMVGYKRLKGRYNEVTSANSAHRALYDNLNAQHVANLTELKTSKSDIESSRERVRALEDEICHTNDQILTLNERVVAYEEQFQYIKRQYEALQEKNETLEVDAVAREKSAQLKISNLEMEVKTLSEIVRQKESEIRIATDRAQYVELENLKAKSFLEKTDRIHEAKWAELEAQLSTAHQTISKLRSDTDVDTKLQREIISQLEDQLTEHKLQLEVVTEGANAARTALETYKKRAHSALKKASIENKFNLEKVAQNAIKLEQELVMARGRISGLDIELQEVRQHLEAAKNTEDAHAQSIRIALKNEQNDMEAALRSEIDSLRTEVSRLEQALEKDKTSIQQLAEQNKALKHEVIQLKEEVRTSTEQATKFKVEISELSRQLEAALAAASLATDEARPPLFSPPFSPVEKDRRSTASSSRSFDDDGNGSVLYQTTIDEQHDRIAAAVVDACPVPHACKTTLSNVVEQQTKSHAKENDVKRLQAQLEELESTSHFYRKKYEDTFTQLKEVTTQQQNGEHSLQAINTEYLKNVMMKYIESQVTSEKEQLVPVISTLLNFSPQEQQKMLAAHRPPDEGVGLLSGVFSLFASGTTSKPFAAPSSFQSPPTLKGSTTDAAIGGKNKYGVLSFGSDDEEFVTPLNPFAA